MTVTQDRIYVLDPGKTLGALHFLSFKEWTIQEFPGSRELLEELRKERGEIVSTVILLDGDEGSGISPDLLFAGLAAIESKVPPIAISVVSSRERGRTWKAAGAASFLLRPVEPLDLRDEIDGWFRAWHLLCRGIHREESLRKFFAMYAHDLKNPLAAVAGYCELALGNEELPAELRDDLIKVIRNVELLNSMARGLIELVRGPDALRIVAREVSLSDVVRGAVDMLRLRAAAKKIELRIQMDEQGTVRLDPSRMIEALANLLDNAIKFSPTMSLVDIHTVLDPESIEITIDDEGPGIAPTDRERIFERFTPATARLPEGNLGLGLSIARDIVGLHGGAIRAEPRSPRGTRIAIRLPRGIRDGVDGEEEAFGPIAGQKPDPGPFDGGGSA
jgi:signal transduction histidine kinase